MKSSLKSLYFMLSALIVFSLLPTFNTRAEDNTTVLSNHAYLPVILNQNSSTSSDSVTGILVNDGTVQTPAGVGIGALSSSLANPVTVTLETTISPGVDLPPLTQAVTDYYKYSASETVNPPFAHPLIIAFPVPDGIDPNMLAAAVLQSGSEVLDADSASVAWSVLEGKYDPANKLFLTTLNALDPVGRVLVLLTGPTFSSPANNQGQDSNQLNTPGSVPFSAKCTNFSNLTDCTIATETAVETKLSSIYQRLQVELGYLEPRLRQRIDDISYFPNSITYLGYSASIEPHNVGFCNLAAGYYTPTESRLVICFDPAVGLSDYIQDVIVHEYFHATQFAYPQVFQDDLNAIREDWIIEGMAKSSEKSYLVNEMRRSNSGGWVQLHKVDVPINKPDANSATPGGLSLMEYFAQDFWVFAGQRLSQNISYLKDILNQGSITQDVANVLGDGDRLDLYFQWAKNQVMDAEIDFEGSLLSPCTIELGVVKKLEIFDYDYYKKIFHTVTVAPLNTIVVKINFDHNYDIAYVDGLPEDPSQPGASQSFKFKVYKDGESGCESVPDATRFLYNVTPGEDYYVVVSNIDINDAYNYLLYIEAGPTPPS